MQFIVIVSLASFTGCGFGSVSDGATDKAASTQAPLTNDSLRKHGNNLEAQERSTHSSGEISNEAPERSKDKVPAAEPSTLECADEFRIPFEYSIGLQLTDFGKFCVDKYRNEGTIEDNCDGILSLYFGCVFYFKNTEAFDHICNARSTCDSGDYAASEVASFDLKYDADANFICDLNIVCKRKAAAP